MNKSSKAVVLTLALAAVSYGGVNSPAAARTITSPCTAYTTPLSSSTAIDTNNPNNCYRVQARIDRYVNGTVKTYYGATSATYSFISNSSGTNAGNLVRVYPFGGDWNAWVTA